MIMKDNKLIAEFMGFTKDSKDLYLIDDYSLRGEDEYQATYVSEMKYHTSWDWLRPVVEKCFVKQEEVSDDLSFKLNDALLETNNESLYRIVVEFIKTYNDEIKQIEINTINT